MSMTDLEVLEYFLEKGANSKIVAAPPRPKPEGVSSEDLIHPGGAAGVLDALFPWGWGGARAGRAETLARSIGDDEIPFTVKHPQWSSGLGVLGGMLGGGLLGAGAGKLGGKFIDIRKATGMPENDIAGMGGAIGMGAGSLLGLILPGIMRRKKIKEIARKFDEHEGDIEPTTRKSRIFGASPAHARGREEAFKMLMEGPGTPVTGSTTANVASVLNNVPYVSLASGLGLMAAAPFIQQDSNDNMDAMLKKHT